MRQIGKKMAAALCTALFVGLLFSPAAGAQGEWKKFETKNIVVEEGTTDALGGGDYVFIKFRNDAAFGVMYGTKGNENAIYIVAIHTRYLGVAQAYDENGALVGKNVPIMIYTLFAQKLEDLFEFNDTDGDGVAMYRKSGEGMFYYDYLVHEPIYKMASLTTAWTRSKVTETSDSEAKERSWEFSLTATNLSYKTIGLSSINQSVQNDVLDKVEFTFHLDAGLVYIENQTMPQYRVEVRKETGMERGRGYTVQSTERIEDRNVSGRRGHYTVKYDHLISGWDFDPTNENPMLLLENYLLVGNVIPEGVVEWMKMQFMKGLGGCGQAVYETDDGTHEATEDDAVNESSLVPDLPKRLKGGLIELKANWEPIGNLTWVSNVTVDGQEKQMYAQIGGFKKIAAVGPKGNAFAGFAALAGFSYPGGSGIFHDPAMSGDSFIEMDLGLGGFVLTLALVAALVAVVVAVVAVASVHRTRKAKSREYFSGSFESYEPGTDQGAKEGGDWERYYARK